jgi:hypothetical protein
MRLTPYPALSSEDLAQKIKEKLQIKKLVITDELLNDAAKLIGITDDGKIVFKIDRTHLPVTDQILLLLAGFKLAAEARLREKPHSSLDEITEALQINPRIVRARLSELAASYKISRVEKGVYAISDLAFHEIINRLARQSEA